MNCQVGHVPGLASYCNLPINRTYLGIRLRLGVQRLKDCSSKSAGFLQIMVLDLVLGTLERNVVPGPTKAMDPEIRSNLAKSCWPKNLTLHWSPWFCQDMLLDQHILVDLGTTFYLKTSPTLIPTPTLNPSHNWPTQSKRSDKWLRVGRNPMVLIYLDINCSRFPQIGLEYSWCWSRNMSIYQVKHVHPLENQPKIGWCCLRTTKDVDPAHLIFVNHMKHKTKGE